MTGDAHHVQTLPNFYRLGVASEKNLFSRRPNLYEGVVVGAHYLGYFQASTENFLASLGKPFFIDPMTYVFARPIELRMRDAGSMKRTFEKLLTLYGSEFARVTLSQSGLSPADFKKGNDWNGRLVDDLCNNVIRLQRKLLELESREELQKLLELAEQPLKKGKPRLLFLVPPYFYADGVEDEWYSISLHLARVSNKLKGKLKMYPLVCISKKVLISGDFAKIAKDYSEFDGAIFWISDLEDDREGAAYLKGLTNLVGILSRGGKPVFSMYGGYFFAILSKLGLAGFSSSICYGQSKEVDRRATGGGQPLRYYIPTLRTKVSEIDARLFYSSHIDELCTCTICSAIRERVLQMGFNPQHATTFVDRFFELLDIESAKEHFMENRYRELVELKNGSLKDEVDRLHKDYLRHQLLGRSFGKNLDPSHMENWSEILSEFTR